MESNKKTPTSTTNTNILSNMRPHKAFAFERKWKRQKEKSIAKQWKKWSVVFRSCAWFAFNFVYENQSKFTSAGGFIAFFLMKSEFRNCMRRKTLYICDMTENLTEWPWFFSLSRQVATLKSVCVFILEQNWNVVANGFIQAKRGKNPRKFHAFLFNF